jgi:hypothetical protein
MNNRFFLLEIDQKFLQKASVHAALLRNVRHLIIQSYCNKHMLFLSH